MADDSATTQPAVDPYPIMRRYLALGLSVFPLGPAKKGPSFRALPGGKWGRYQERLAREDELNEWQQHEPNAGIGIVCGFASGGDQKLCLTCLDLDSPEFSHWLENNVADALLRKTWTVRSGSGRLHVYLYSRQPVRTSSLTAKGEHAADIRGHGNPQIGTGGSYMAAPPSIHEKTGAPYVTLYGDPATIALVDDAALVFQKLLTHWAQAVEVTTARDPRGKTIQPPADEIAQRTLIRKMAHKQVPHYIRRTIIDGYEPGEGDWPNAPTHSHVDFGVVVSLLRCEFTREEVECLYASFPVGEPTYRNISRPDHGWLYLDYTIRNAQQELQRQKEAQAKASGDNFDIVRVVRVDYDSEPEYRVTIRFTDTGHEATCKLRAEDVTSLRGFQNAIFKGSNEMPMVGIQFQGKSFYLFSQLIGRMAERESVPIEATGIGHLRAKVFEILNREMSDHRPVERGELRIGWWDEQMSTAFVVGSVLISRLGASLRPAPRPEQLWEVLRGLGGSEKTVVFSGTRERLWTLPLGQLRQAMGMDTPDRRAHLRIGMSADAS